MRNSDRIRPLSLAAPALAALALGSLAALAGGDEASSPMTNTAAEAAVAKVAPKVEEIRGLDFKTPVPVEVLDDAAAREHAKKRFWKFYTKEQLRAEQTAYTLLGLLPEGSDLLEEYLTVLEEQAGGFYDPAEKSFFLLDDMPIGIAPMLAAHELTHALEDQHFDLDRRLGEVIDDGDRVFAASAVHEGSATLVMTIYMVAALADGSMDPSDLATIAETEAGRGERLDAMPAVLKRPLLGSYVLGMAFLVKGDPGAILAGYPREDAERCYRSGPLSSEQILHPEKYWDPARRDDPTPVDLGRAGKSLGRGWKRAGTGVLGELVLGAMVGAPTPGVAIGAAGSSGGEWTNDAASGWDGDRWEVWTRDGSAVVLLETVWDSPEDAREFAEAIRERPGLVSRTAGNTVAVIAGPAGKRAGRVLEAMLLEPGRPD